MAEETYSNYLSLNNFFHNELELYKHNNKSNRYIVTFNIGTYGSINQELNVEWLNKIEQYILLPQYNKIFYYIDNQYKMVDMDKLITNFQNSIQLYFKNKFIKVLEFNVTNNSFQNIESVYNKKYNITIHKISENIPTSYSYLDIITNSYKTDLKIDRTYNSLPKLKFWKRLYLLLDYFKNINDSNIIYINNFACTNTNMFMELDKSKSKYLKIYIGKYLEYFSELGYILRYLYKNNNFNEQVLFRYNSYEDNEITIKPIIQLKNFRYELLKEWTL
jgi:hypothetical protein